MQIIAVDVSTRTWRILIDHKEIPDSDRYAGIFLSSLPNDPFSADGTYALNDDIFLSKK